MEFVYFAEKSFPLVSSFFIISAGNPTIAYDVATNSEFYKKTEKSKLFLTFLLTVVMEGLKDKYSLDFATEGTEELCGTRQPSNFNCVIIVCFLGTLMKSKVVPLYAMEALWGRGDIAHS
jgi:hypothetical protein